MRRALVTGSEQSRRASHRARAGTPPLVAGWVVGRFLDHPQGPAVPIARSRLDLAALRHVAVDGPELGGRGRSSASRLEGGHEALVNEPLRLLLRLPDLDHPPAAVWARPGSVEDAAGGLLQAEFLADVLVDLLRALGVVDHHRD